ncbi:MAG: RIP metalloprotease RseP [Desulfuromonadales bacterium GWD2_61_12]|nr:MAG: RIP metalloprotease RseP [Desulfuromonadales bacterium GWC2_61_20]OGR36370.1 MAG: RIP metalloprotease RseP [Desulfuromonadales bacterium GWD2_61_12]HAD03374.1 RIP metalloprotease RseP [Desulfuromonas sp.]HBT82918.1 RIP metalloprotease RseP [Desulfuromonas sp.]
MVTIVAGIVMLGILVFVHELGHFCVAKLAGVKILKFSLGFGPKLYARQWGETTYQVCVVPLGGYVQMLGEGSGEAGEDGELTAAEKERSFADKPVAWRTAIIAAGPLMNLLLPFVVMPLAYLVGVNMPAYLDQPACVGYVVTESDGGKAGFVPGDCLLAINGEAVASWNLANQALISHVGAPLKLTVERGGGTRIVEMAPEDGGIEGLQSLGLLPQQDAVIGSLAPGMPAQAGGLLVGDRIVAIGATPVVSWYDLKQIIQTGQGEAQTYTVERQGERLTFAIKPAKADGNGDAFLIGIAPQQAAVLKRFGPVAALQAGSERTVELVKLTLVFIQKLFTGNVSTKSIGGPITVVQIAGQAAQTDLAAVLSVLAFLSIQLGILNLLPIPILDGGHLLFNFLEFIARRPLSMRAREIAQQIGLGLLILLMIVAFYNDIVRLFFAG